MNEPIIDLLDAEWGSLVDLAADFTPDDWATATELPGWTVQDCYAHVTGTERVLQGHAVPEVDLSGAVLTAPSAPFTEPPVAARRGWSGQEVLAELVAVRAERIAELRSLTPERWDEVGPTPIGQAPYREFMNVRTFDCWMHEQDVRRALGRPGHVEGPVAEHAMGRCTLALGFVVGKKAGAPDGSVVTFAVTGPLARELTVVVADGRARVADGPVEAPETTRLTMDQETFWCLGGGRWNTDAVLGGRRLTIDGDRELGLAVLAAMNFMI
jgi:uncharacterized protein (TIGR03083 family)